MTNKNTFQWSGSPCAFRPQLRWAVIGAGLLLPLFSLGAQLPVDTAQLATITTDTGAFAPGDRDFTHYNTPDLCRAAAVLTEAKFQRTLAEQIQASGNRWTDTVGAGATAAVARACGAHFTLAAVQPTAYEDFLGLAVYEQNDALALAVLAASLAQKGQDTTDHAVYTMNLLNQHGRFAAAETLLARFDGPGVSAKKTELRLLEMLRSRDDNVADSGRIRQITLREIALARTHELHADAYLDMVWCYQWLMKMAVQEDSAAVARLAQQAKADLSVFSAADQLGCMGDDCGDWRKYGTDSLIGHLAPKWYTFVRDNGSEPAPRLQANFWFPAPGQPSSDTLRPVKGKVNLICQGPLPQNEPLQGDPPAFYDSLSGTNYATRIRHWLMQYGAAGLAVTIVRRAPLYDYDVKDFGQNWSVYTDPAVEANKWQWYDQVYEHLPVAVAVQVQPTVKWLPGLDGRRYMQRRTQFKDYFKNNNSYDYGVEEEADACAVISRDGVILFNTGGAYQTPNNPRMIDGLLKWLFKGPGASPVVSPVMSASPVPRAASPVLPSVSSSSPRGIAP